MNLADAFTKGYLKIVRGKSTNFDTEGQSPPRNKHWLILCGEVHHVTTNDTYFVVCEKDKLSPFASGASLSEAVFRRFVGNAEATAEYPIFATKSDEKNGAWQPIILDDQMCMAIGDNAACTFRVLVIEW